jgi:N-acyl homoserine lactone hydrolase
MGFIEQTRWQMQFYARLPVLAWTVCVREGKVVHSVLEDTPMRRRVFIVPFLAADLLLAAGGSASAQTSGVERLYVLDCGEAHAPDQSRWSPGVNVGKPIDISDNCYLIHHKQGWMLWDTGIPDAVAEMREPAPGPIPWRRGKTLAFQLASIGVQPADIKYVGISHTHADHVGNVDLFPTATVLIQRAEYEWAFASDKKPFSAAHSSQQLDGDHDVFGDKSVMIISTPGHTPGHESLMVDLPKTGWLLLSGDVAHFQDNFDNRRVPAGNTDKDKSVTSMQRVADLVAKYHAQFWINHDAPQTARTRHAPEFYE